MTLRRWRIALAAWLGLIFLLSSSLFAPQMSADGTREVFGSLNYLARKFAHIAEYGILTYLFLRSIRTSPERFGRSLAWSVLLSVLYAIADEFHQSLVPQRDGTWHDVLFDTAGALTMGYLLWRVKTRGSADLRKRLLGPPGEDASTDRAEVALK